MTGVSEWQPACLPGLLLPETTVAPQCKPLEHPALCSLLVFHHFQFDDCCKAANCRVGVCPAYCAALQVARRLMCHLMVLTRTHTHTHYSGGGKQRRITCSLAHLDHKRVIFFTRLICAWNASRCHWSRPSWSVCNRRSLPPRSIPREPRFDGCHLSLR